MATAMRVTLYPVGWDAMGYHRLIWPAQVLQRQGHDIVITDPNDQSRILWRPNGHGDVADVTIPETDVAVFQRVTQKSIVQVIAKWQAAGIRVVVDMDDDLSVVTPHTNPGAFKLLHDKANREGLHWMWADEACKIADGVIASTQAIYDRYAHGHGFIVRNGIPASNLREKHTRENVDPRLIGWTGAIKYRAQDPAVVGGALSRLTREGHRFRAVSEANPEIAAAFRIDYERQVEVTGFQPIEHYAAAIACLGVGIVPLADTAFNRAKSWLTPLVMASCGVPVVMSDLPEYRLLTKYGFGGLARNPRQWYALTKTLASNDDLYWQTSDHARKAAAKLTIENNADKWWSAWTGESQPLDT